MNNLEDRLREGLHAPTDDVVAESMLARVRSGARRRRQRRTAAIVTASVAVVAAGLVSVGLIDRDGGPIQPAPPTGTPPANVVDVAVPDADHLFALTTHDGSAVWLRSDSGAWQRLHEFRQPLEYVEFAPDARNGWAWGSGLWSTHDGGRTWLEVTDGPGASTEYGHWVHLTNVAAWSLHRTPQGKLHLWSAPLGADAWSLVRLPAPSSVINLETTRSRVLLESANEGAGQMTLLASNELDGWSRLDFPCTGENQAYPAPTAVFVLCPAPDGASIHRSLDLAPWQVFGTSDLTSVTAVLPLSDDRLLLIGEPRDLLVTADGATPVDVGLSPGEEIFQGTFGTAGDTTYAVTSEHRILVSNDAGENWSALD